MNKYSIGIVGHRGYSGLELVRLLSHHPYITPILLEHRDDPQSAPRIRRKLALSSIPSTPVEVREAGLAVVFLATPPEVSMELAPAMLESGTKVIDLSGAFRLRTPENYQLWYNHAHTQQALLAEAVYGLPEFYRDCIPSARLIANPGCYPTAANLALRPLLEAGIIDLSAGVVCDAKSGVSGAGRKPSSKTHFCEVTENFSAYGVLEHRHVAEVLQVSEIPETAFSFTAQLLPLDRGILETIYFRSGNVSCADEILSVYERRYAQEPFVRLYEPGGFPDLHSVARTNFCDIGVRFEKGRGVIVVAIDNLVKGAAGQAVQNMNLALGLPESEGLL